MPRTYFSPEVKQHAIALVLDDHLTIAGAAQQVGCSVNALHNQSVDCIPAHPLINPLLA